MLVAELEAKIIGERTKAPAVAKRSAVSFPDLCTLSLPRSRSR